MIKLKFGFDEPPTESMDEFLEGVKDPEFRSLDISFGYTTSFNVVLITDQDTIDRDSLYDLVYKIYTALPTTHSTSDFEMYIATEVQKCFSDANITSTIYEDIDEYWVTLEFLSRPKEVNRMILLHKLQS